MAHLLKVGISVWLVAAMHDFNLQTSLLLGEIVSVEALGRTMIILSSPEAIAELLERRGSRYSDRPVLMMTGEL